jgi:small subunit ribosomal protein S1
MAEKKVKKQNGKESRADEKQIAGAAGGEDDFAQMLEESFKTVKTLQVGNEVDATVLGSDNEYVFLDLGTRLDGMVRKGELMRNGELSVSEGDTIKVFVTGQRSGAWMCSCRLGSSGAAEQDPKKVAALMSLGEAFNANTPVEGKVSELIKGGFIVQVMGLKAFCPLSQISTEFSDNPDSHLNQTYTFYVMQFEEDGSNIVISRKEYLQHEARKKEEKLWQEVEEGGVYEGTIKAIQDYGAFVDIGGIEGLLHISEISHARIEKPSDVLKIGQTLDVAVLEVDRQRRKLSLSVKTLLEDPWDTVTKKLKVGGEYQGKVVRLKTYGAFVQLFPGVDGMVHISRLGTGRTHKHPKEVLKTGEMITVRVLDIDKESKRISLTMEKDEGDYSSDLEKLKKQQNKDEKNTDGHMASLVDAALDND